MARSDTASARTRRLAKFIRFVLTIVIATVMGPLIGGAAVFLVSATQMSQSEFDADGVGRLFFHIMYGAYLFGGVIAFVAGTLVAGAALWRQPTFPVIIAATVVASVGYEVAIGDGVQQDRLLINLAASAFAATICWLLFRRLLRNP